MESELAKGNFSKLPSLDTAAVCELFRRLLDIPAGFLGVQTVVAQREASFAKPRR
jgi:hypothetical protein